MGQAILNAVGRMFAAVVAGLWNALVLPILQGIGHALAVLARQLVPWVVGVGGFFLLVRYNPEAANAVLSLTIVIGVVYAGWRVVTRSTPKAKRK